MRLMIIVCVMGVLTSSCNPNSQRQAENLISEHELQTIEPEEVYICKIVRPALNGLAGEATFGFSASECFFTGMIIEGPDHIRDGMSGLLLTYANDMDETQIVVSQHFLDTVVRRDRVMESVRNIN